MKLSFVVEVPEKVESLKEFYRRLKMLKELGYDGAELAIRNTRKIEREKVKTLIEGLGLEVPAIATGRAYLTERLSFCHPSKRQAALARIKDHIKFASSFDAQVIIGLIRGNPEKGQPTEGAYRLIVDALKECGEFAAKYNVKLTLEAINRYEMDFIHTLKEAREIMKKTGCHNTGILADTFHMNIEEEWISESIADVGDFITHVHIADSNRMAPGEGHLDFEEILSSIAATGYNGFLSIELVPIKPDFDTAARQAIECLRTIIEWKKI